MLTEKDKREVRALRASKKYLHDFLGAISGKLCGVEYRVTTEAEADELLEPFWDIA